MTGRRQFLVDVGIALLCLAAMAVELGVSHKPDTSITPLSLLAVTAASAPAAWRRRSPRLAYAGCLAGLGVVVAVSNIYLTIPYPCVVTAYALAVAGGIRHAAIVGAVTVPVVLAIIGFSSPHGLLNW